MAVGYPERRPALSQRAARREVWRAIRQTLQADLDSGAGWIYGDIEQPRSDAEVARMERAVHDIMAFAQRNGGE